MTSAFDRALERTLAYEGGYVNNPLDRGGPTNRGITQRAYDAWRKTTGQEPRSVDLVEDAEVRAIYLADYWMPCNCDSLPEPIGAAVFDMAVNSGVWNAKITLQNAVRVRADGVIGEATIAAANATPNALLRFLKGRAAFIAEILHERPTQCAFLEGWINRLLDQCYYLRA